MRPKYTYMPVLIITVLGLLGSVVAYTRSAEDPQMPVRIRFDNNGGKVLFSHLVHHRDYGVDCASCHHDRRPVGAESHTDEEISATGEVRECGTCHPVAFDENFMAGHMGDFETREDCVRCHHTEYGELIFDHGEHEEYGECTDCHHGDDIEPEPRKCSDCHAETDSGVVPSMRVAGHERCGTCHEDMFDQGLSSCRSCHVAVDMSTYEGDFTTCGQCHEGKTRDMVLPRMNAFHDQCMDCHEELGVGPYGQESCQQCHIR
jgi:hypothetical protein